MTRIFVTSGDDDPRATDALEQMGPELLRIHCHRRGMLLEVNSDEVPSLQDVTEILHLISHQIMQTLVDMRKQANTN